MLCDRMNWLHKFISDLRIVFYSLKSLLFLLQVTNFAMAQKMESYCINGPTQGNSLGPFSWTGKFANISHPGLPEKYSFDWVTMEPVL